MQNVFKIAINNIYNITASLDFFPNSPPNIFYSLTPYSLTYFLFEFFQNAQTALTKKSPGDMKI